MRATITVVLLLCSVLLAALMVVSSEALPRGPNKLRPKHILNINTNNNNNDFNFNLKSRQPASNKRCLEYSHKFFGNTYPVSQIMTGFFIGWGPGILNDLVSCGWYLGALENATVQAMVDFGQANYTGMLWQLGNAFEDVADTLINCQGLGYKLKILAEKVYKGIVRFDDKGIITILVDAYDIYDDISTAVHTFEDGDYCWCGYAVFSTFKIIIT
jgi:hypothetical protein